jgi:hypothetical protein
MAVVRGLEAGRHGEQGSVLPMVLITTLSVGALSMAHLTKVMAENKKVREEVCAARAQAAADAELEFAKNVVNAAPYVDGRNQALTNAVLALPPVIAGTSVRVAPVGDSTDWYVLRATGTCQQVTKVSQVFCRQATPVAVYNYFVVDHKLGLTGSPRGMVHTNKSIDFFFPGGLYRDPVTASEGFNFVYGADANNTSFLSTWDAHAAPYDIMANLDVTQANKPNNTLNVIQPYIAEVKLQKDHAQVKLYDPGHYITVPVQVAVKVFDHYDTVNKTKQVPVYTTVQVTTTQPVYQNQVQTVTVQVPIYATQQVPVTVYSQVWVVDPPPPPGSIGSGDLGGGAAGGHYVTVSSVVMQSQQVVVGYNSVQQQKTVKVQVGTQQVTTTKQVVDHYDTVVVPTQVAVYITQMQTQYQQQWVPEQLVSTQNVAASGVFYFEGPVRTLDGPLSGRLSIVSDTSVNITGTLQYVDDHNRPRMNNGTDPTSNYEPNPAYTGNAVLGVLSTGDITYANTVSDAIEVNASLMSKNGSVLYQGITVTNNGETVGYSGDTTQTVRLKGSMRRLGGIVSRYRPVATYVASNGAVYAGFQKGASQMDRNLMIGGGGSLPFTYQETKPVWTMQKAGSLFDAQ